MRVPFYWVAMPWAIWLWLVTLVYVLAPSYVPSAWGLPVGAASHSMGLRVAGLVLAWGVVLFLARKQPPSPSRSAIVIGSVVGCFATAAGGVYSFATGLAGPLILVTAGIEVVVGIAFVLVELTARRDASHESAPVGADDQPSMGETLP